MTGPGKKSQSKSEYYTKRNMRLKILFGLLKYQLNKDLGLFKFLVVSLLIVFSNICCESKHEKIEKIMENGVEVIFNYRVPYKIKGEKTKLSLKRDFIIDLERGGLAELGISNVTGFDVDSIGNVYLGIVRSSENFIFKFDRNGKFVNSFGRLGQGPGEFQRLGQLRINKQDEILISNRDRKRIIVFNTSGRLIREVPIASNHIVATLLENRKILAMKFVPKPGKGLFYPIVICDSDLENSKILRQGQRLQNYVAAKKLNGLNLAFDYTQWSVSNGLIFIGNKFNGYEFLAYDLNGKLVRKIKKEYDRVKVPQQLKEKVIKKYNTPSYNENNIKDKIYFPDYMLPFQYFFTDDVGRLYVMTYEKGEGDKDYIYDIFNPKGLFISRTVLDNSGNPLGAPPFQELSLPWGGPYDVKVRNNRLYYMRGKESGYQELVVCEMIWR